MKGEDVEFCDRGPCSATKDHEGTCAEASGWVVTCDDLGCVDGRTIQGREFDVDGTVHEQWAPCGRFADTCRHLRIHDLIERSSFGTPAAKAARESVTDEQVRRVLERAEELRREAGASDD